jgi:hypothetical protein
MQGTRRHILGGFLSPKMWCCASLTASAPTTSTTRPASSLRLSTAPLRCPPRSPLPSPPVYFALLTSPSTPMDCVKPYQRLNDRVHQPTICSSQDADTVPMHCLPRCFSTPTPLLYFAFTSPQLFSVQWTAFILTIRDWMTASTHYQFNLSYCLVNCLLLSALVMMIFKAF